MEAQVKSKSAPPGLEASPNYVRILNDAEWFILGYAQAQGGPRPSGRLEGLGRRATRDGSP